jgi:hypothetical protein
MAAPRKQTTIYLSAKERQMLERIEKHHGLEGTTGALRFLLVKEYREITGAIPERGEA